MEYKEMEEKRAFEFFGCPLGLNNKDVILNWFQDLMKSGCGISE
jgi:hypothetical protein